jgi:hypothetical protein
MRTTQKLEAKNGFTEHKDAAVVAGSRKITQRVSRFGAAKMKVTYNHNGSTPKADFEKIFGEIANGIGLAIARIDHERER